MFSKACEYGIRATIHLARLSEKDQRSSLKEVAKAIDSPVAFTGKILQSLARNGIILSIKGPMGGYEISKSKLSTLALSEIVDAIDGGNIYKGCGLGLKNCNESKPCPMHFQFKEIRDNLKQMLEVTTVQDLASELHGGLTFLKR